MNKPQSTVPMSRPSHDRQVLAGQIALVTGANSGIGKAVAIGLGKAGADVIVNYVSDNGATDAVVAEIEAAGSRAVAIRADVSKEAEVQAMFRQTLDLFGTLHILVNNAGLQRDARFDEMTLDGHVNYAASKGGVMLLMKSMAQELAPFRIRVNSVGPGAIRTPINRAAWSTPEAYAELMKLVPYERIGEPEDIAEAVAWLASDASDYVTGTTLFVDGGMTLYPGFATGG